MLDPHFIANNLDLVQKNCHLRKVNVDLKYFNDLYVQRKSVQSQFDNLRHQQKEIAQKTKKAPDHESRIKYIEEGKKLKQESSELESQLKNINQVFKAELIKIPNLSHPETPEGNSDLDNKALNQFLEPTSFDFKPLDHVQLAEMHDLVDFKKGSSVAGRNFYFLKNQAVLMELALIRYAVDKLVSRGYTPLITPDLARSEVVTGTGFTPRGEETQIYSIENHDLSLIATSEIPIAGMLMNETIHVSQLPQLYTGISHCFRTEAGAYGRASKGLYRVHQFSKVEMFAFTHPDQSEEMFQQMLVLEEEIFQELKLPYRMVDCCTGDLGGPAFRKYDLEAWMPGRGEDGSWGEVTSLSNCTDFQARNLNIKYKGDKGKGLVHTLNGTALAVSRALIAILENYQQADGSIVIPKVLIPYTGFKLIDNRPL